MIYIHRLEREDASRYGIFARKKNDQKRESEGSSGHDSKKEKVVWQIHRSDRIISKRLWNVNGRVCIDITTVLVRELENTFTRALTSRSVFHSSLIEGTCTLKHIFGSGTVLRCTSLASNAVVLLTETRKGFHIWVRLDSTST